MPESVSYSNELSFAKDLAVEAGKVAMAYFGSDIAVQTKPDMSPVTEADETINQLVVDACKRHFPDYGVLGEENSWHPERAWKWICDPIDGTADFVADRPNFMFSLSLDHDGQPVAALTLHPVSGDMYWASFGGGAFMNGQPIHASSRSLTQAKLVFPTNPNVLSAFAKMYDGLDEVGQETTHIHSSVYKGMKIADGTYDAAIWPGTVHPWDVHAVKLIVEEAGGRVTDLSGQPYQRYDQDLRRGLLVDNGILHEELVRAVITDYCNN